MKQTLKLIGIALLGGLTATGITKYIENTPNSIEQVQAIQEVKTIQAEPISYSSHQNAPYTTSLDFIEAADKTVHSVVYILSEFNSKSSVYDDYFSPNDFFNKNQPNTIRASGSGVILSSDGYIVTNNHVVQQASKVTVTLNDKREYTATLVGTDPSTDLALLKIDAQDLTYLTYGNSDDIKVGEWVLAVGNPFNLTSTVTAGIVSAKARDINILGSQTSIESFIQTDAAVNPGNSGGALVNTEGKLVGINAAIASRTGSFIGYSFAIPVTIVKKVVTDLKEYGEVKRAYIGVTIQNINSKLAAKLKLKNIKGVYVEGIIHGGGAEKAGIKPGSVILNIEGKEVNSGSELLEKVGMHRPGDKISVSVLKGEETINHEVVLTDLYGGINVKSSEESKSIEQKIGAKFGTLSNKKLQSLKLNYGVEVTEVNEGLFREAGIKPGFIILKIDQTRVEKTTDIQNTLNNKKGGVLIEGIYPNGEKAFYGFGI